jgi:S1-C subfamily serine protease
MIKTKKKLAIKKLRRLINIFMILYSVNLFAQTSSWNETNLKEYWKANGADDIEGIYLRQQKIKATGPEGTKNVNSLIKTPYYIVRIGNNFELGIVNGEKVATIIQYENGTMVILTTPYLIIGFENNPNTELRTFLIRTSESSLQIDNLYIQLDDDEYVNIYDIFERTYKPSNNKANLPSSGSGFAISSNGLIVTNFHVIEGAKIIKVRGVNSDFSILYKAKVLVSDKNNDLAIIQIDDYNFKTLGSIPFTIKTSLSEVGENIFVLGYPLRASMGDEIKLTNGIISSKTGFQGDITSYQISAPVQPGNSGGPLFDNQGNLIGVINAKLMGAENATYAVKSRYLTSLIELLSSPTNFQRVNLLSGKTLSQQVELAKKFIYIIETE